MGRRKHATRMAEHLNTDSPLAGRTIIDLTTFLSGPFCTQILADLGARVIKIEPPTGDTSRSIPPYFVDGSSAYYMGINRNKESVAIDLKSPAGQEILRTLISKSDAVVENFRPGVCERIGLPIAELLLRDRRLTWVSISGFGQDGPWHDRVAYDMVVQALSGVMSLTGERNGNPVRLGVPAGDLVAGLYAAIGLLSAMLDPGSTNRHVDISMLDGQLSMLSYQATYSMISNVTPGPQGTGHDSIATYRAFVGSDRRSLVVTANTERMWRSMCEVLGAPDLPSDSRFATAAARLENQEELWSELEPKYGTAPAASWVEALNAASVPAALIKTVPEAIADAEESGHGMVVELTSDKGEQLRTLRTPIRFVNADQARSRFPPRLGEHTQSVLREMAELSQDEFQFLIDSGIVIAPTGS